MGKMKIFRFFGFLAISKAQSNADKAELVKGIIETQEDTKKEDFLSKIADEVEHLGDMMNVFKGMELFNYLRDKVAVDEADDIAKALIEEREKDDRKLTFK